MLKFNRKSAGSYNASHNGQAIEITREGASYWALYVGGKFAGSLKTLTEAKIEANTVAGNPEQFRPVAKPTTTTATPKPAKTQGPRLPVIYRNKKGLYIYGLNAVCEILEDSRVDTGLPGKVCIKPGKPGKSHGYFVSTECREDLWHLLREELPGQQIQVVTGKDRTVVEIPAL
jgi:hypothetical protein